MAGGDGGEGKEAFLTSTPAYRQAGVKGGVD